MKNILVCGSQIIAINPEDIGTAWVTGDQVIEKHIVPAQVVSVAVPDGFSVAGYEYVGGQVVKKMPTEGELIAARSAKASECDLIAKSKRDGIVKDISAAEMASWPIKRSEAISYQATNDASLAPMLSAESAARGVTLPALAEKVLAKSVALSVIEAGIAGCSGRHQDAINALDDLDEISAYDISAGWPV